VRELSAVGRNITEYDPADWKGSLRFWKKTALFTGGEKTLESWGLEGENDMGEGRIGAPPRNLKIEAQFGGKRTGQGTLIYPLKYAGKVGCQKSGI